MSKPADKTGSKICCSIRCMDPAAVEAASGRLDDEGTVRVPYTCQISGKQEDILLLGDRLAERLAAAMPEAVDAAGAKILAGLFAAELCECDVATLTGLAEDEVFDRLRAFAECGLLAHRRLHDMNYFSLASGDVCRQIEALIR